MIGESLSILRTRLQQDDKHVIINTNTYLVKIFKNNFSDQSFTTKSMNIYR